MKKLFNIVALLLMAALLVIPVTAASFATNDLAVGTHHLIDGAKVARSMTFFSRTSTIPTLVYIYDGPYTTTSVTHTAYTEYTTNIVTSITDGSGTRNITNRVLYKAPTSTTGGVITERTPIKILSVPANGDIITLTDPLIFSQRIQMSNNIDSISVLIDYISP